MAPALLPRSVMLDRPVIVVGAGLAGLVAAYHLARDRMAVTVIEARDRIGGRAWTERARLRDGAYAELGAEFIDEDHRLIRGLAADLGVDIVPVLREGFTLRYHGDEGECEVGRTRPWNGLAAAMAVLTREYKRAHGKPDAEGVRELSTYSVREWLNRQQASPRIHSVANALRGFFLADPDDLSALPLAAELAQGGSPAETPVYRVAGGNDRLLDAIRLATASRLLLRHRLLAVRHSTDRVVCSVLDDRGQQQSIEGRAAIITVPATVLADIDIAPALPAAQRRAIRALRYGCATKVVMQVSGGAFGGARGRAFATDTHLGAVWDASEGQQAGIHVISFLAGGSASRQLADRLRDGAGQLLADIAWASGGSALQPRAYASWSWESDPLARGGYAYLDPAFDPAWLPLLRQREGRLFFAGEHTSEERQGYMEGAVESGTRAAREVQELGFN